METPLAHHEARLRHHKASLEQIAGLARLVPIGRLATFVLAAACALTFFFNKQPLALAPMAALLVAFVGFGVWDTRIAQREARVQAALLHAQRGIHRVKGELDQLPERGAELVGKPHPYAHDLDLYGKRSLLSLLDAMDAEPGERLLAAWLGEPARPPEVRARQEAARELSSSADFLEELFVHARPLSKADPELPAFRAWCKGKGPSSGARLALAALGVVLPAVTIALLIFGERLGAPASAWALPWAVQWLISVRIGGASGPGLTAAGAGAKALGPLSAIVERVGAAGFRAQKLAQIAERLHGGPDAAGPGLRALDRLSSFAEARESGMFRLFVGPWVMYDAHLWLALERWRDQHGARVEGWQSATAELLALAGLGAYAADHPDHAFPELAEGPSRFEAEGLVHPLLPPGNRVANDVRFGGPGTALLITGSNMSGKSTLLRATGLAAAMAQAGAPVAARSLALSPLLLRTSVRVSDSLAQGVSHFYAELLALRRVVEACDEGPVFFLLDEILHGTNSLERNAGAKAVVRHLLDRGAMGAVTTHDLGLAELAEQLPDRVRPVHLLELAQGDKMVFDYKLRDGVLHSGNALRLMRQLGLPVPADVTS